MTKEEKRLMDLGWKKEKDYSSAEKENWVKEYLLFPVMYARLTAFTQLCIGIFLYDEFLNELHLIYLNDQKFFELTGNIILHPETIQSAEILFDRCDKKIKKETFKVKDLYQDDNFFEHRFCETIYVPHKGNMMKNTNSLYYEFYIFDPDLQDPEKYFFDDILRGFDRATMMELSQDEVIYKKYKLNKDISI